MNVSTIDLALNAAQNSVLDSVEKRILVLAGPGAGKTLVLKEWIKKKLTDKNSKSFKVLGLTFTNKAADEMNSRLSEDLDTTIETKRVNLITFHGFGARVLRQYGYYLGIPANFDICNDQEEQVEILKVGLKKANIEGNYNWKKCLNHISTIKRGGYSPNQNELSEEKYKWINLLYTAYEKELNDSGYIDFDDLLLKTYKLFEAYPTLVKHYQKIYPYICIDELQDTNKVQYLILKYLVGKDTNLLAVGDDNQIIYEWNGADYRRLKNFKEDFQPEIIHLPLNYRCPKSIVVVSNKLMAKNKIRLGIFQPNRAYSLDEGSVEVFNTKTFQEETAAVAHKIFERHRQNLGRVTVLARRKKILEGMGKALKKQNTPFRIYNRKGDFVSAPLVWLHEILNLFSSPNRERSMNLVLGAFNQMSGLDINLSEIQEKKRQETNMTLMTSWLTIVHEYLQEQNNSFKELINLVENKLTIKSYKQFYSAIFKWFNDYQNEQSEIVAKEKIYNFDEYEAEKSVWLSLSGNIFERLGTAIPLSTFLQELSLTTKETPSKPNEVSLMTIHASKGQGFDHVYLIGMVDDELPSYHAIKSTKNEVIEEERRNCYVAITRASKSLTLSYADTYYGWKKRPSRFLNDMELI